MLGPVTPTPYDLHFSAFGIPVRVHPAFWIVGAILGWPQFAQTGAERAIFLGIWLGCLFVSILLHELGHAFAARYFGWPPHIQLYHFGGLAMYTPHIGHTRPRSIFISFAGPLAGFILGGLIWLGEIPLHQAYMAGEIVVSRYAWYAIDILVFLNIFWGLVNLLPVLPLDGGQIARDICTGIDAYRGEEWALKLAILTGAVVAVVCFQHEYFYGGLMFGMLAAQNYQELQQRGRW